ncbi:ATP-grasp domain-containing protein (plasmid) [Neorhizobium sp. DAR64861/K0K2]|uniref:ATP-grasp domain-containing protein n=1 Tax=Neorhizobium sp. DAR64861/K0K2 TaxID=3421956 RepID=UPI003D2C16E4
MAHLVFIDSSAYGLRAFRTAQELGHSVTFVRPKNMVASVFGLTEDRIEESRKFVDRYLVIADLFSGELRAVLRDLDSSSKIDAVITVSDIAALPAAEAAEAIGAPGCNHKALKTASFKDQCREHLVGHKFASARFAVVFTLSEAMVAASDIGFPVIIKPARGGGKLMSSICRTSTEVGAFFKRAERERSELPPAFSGYLSEMYVVEEVLKGPLFSVEVAMFGRQFVALTLTGRALATHDEVVEIGAFMPSGLDNTSEGMIVDYVRDLFVSLGLSHGIFHVEVILTEQGPVLVEINPRAMGGTLPQMYGYVAEVDFFKVLIDASLGNYPSESSLAVKRAAVSLAVGPLHKTIAPVGIEERLNRMFEKFDIFENTLNVSSQQTLKPFTGNFSAIGRVGIAADDHTSALMIGRAFIDGLEDAFQCQFARY